jgi:glycosyltransferase involved in cell wall biosynthesis
MSRAPLVSIVIPAYNHAEHLGAAIDSVLAQSYQPLELIVIDDGSTDGTDKMLSAYSGRCRVEHQPNIGQSATLNKGWRMATGDILSYLGADDVLYPDAVRVGVEGLAADDRVVMTYCDFDLIDSRGERLRVVKQPALGWLDMLRGCICAPGPGAFFRREAFAKTDGWNSKYRQMPDLDFWYRLGLEGTFKKVNGVNGGFRVHEASQTYAVADSSRAEEVLEITREFFKRDNLGTHVLTLRDMSLANAHLVAAQLHMRAGRYRDGLKHLRSGFFHDPGILFCRMSIRRVLHGLLSRPYYQWVLRRHLAMQTREMKS